MAKYLTALPLCSSNVCAGVAGPLTPCCACQRNLGLSHIQCLPCTSHTVQQLLLQTIQQITSYPFKHLWHGVPPLLPEPLTAHFRLEGTLPNSPACPFLLSCLPCAYKPLSLSQARLICEYLEQHIMNCALQNFFGDPMSLIHQSGCCWWWDLPADFFTRSMHTVGGFPPDHAQDPEFKFSAQLIILASGHDILQKSGLQWSYPKVLMGCNACIPTCRSCRVPNRHRGCHTRGNRGGSRNDCGGRKHVCIHSVALAKGCCCRAHW